jgi:hypothetical protein
LVVRARVFLPNLFTGAQILDVTPELQAINAPAPMPESADLLTAAALEEGRFAPGGDDVGYAYLRRWPEHFDVLVWLEPDQEPPVPDKLNKVASGSWFDVYRIRPGSSERGSSSGAAPTRGAGRAPR